MIRDWSRRLGTGTRLVDAPPGAPDEPWITLDRDHDGVVHLPLGDQVAEVGPFLSPAPTWVQVARIVAGGTGIGLLAAAVVVVPLTRRLARLEAALARVRAGELATRVDDRVDDAIGHIAVGFNHMAEALERRVRRQEELLQAVAHEYGTPLARLALRTELLARRLPDEHQARLDDVRRDLGTLELLTGELVSLVELDGTRAAPERVDEPHRVIEEAARDEVLDGAERLRFEVEALAPLAGRSADLRRCVANTVRNALRYARSQVRVSAADRDGAIVVQVDDDGPGIPEHAWELVLEPFSRIEESRDRRTGGVGLGLAIARRCAERLGGTLVVGRSELGGARLELRIERA